jgi:hypothetical protein
LSRASPALRFPEGTGIEITADASLIVRVVAGRDETVSDAPTIKPALEVKTLPAGTPYSRLRFEHLETVADAPTVIPMAVAASLRGIVPTGDTEVEGLTLKHQQKCVVDIPQWERQFAELFRFAAPAGVPLRENDLLQLTCRRRATAAADTRARCGFWLLLE